MISNMNNESGPDRPGLPVNVVGRKETNPHSVGGSNDDSSRNRTGPRTGMHEVWMYNVKLKHAKAMLRGRLFLQ